MMRRAMAKGCVSSFAGSEISIVIFELPRCSCNLAPVSLFRGLREEIKSGRGRRFCRTVLCTFVMYRCGFLRPRAGWRSGRATLVLLGMPENFVCSKEVYCARGIVAQTPSTVELNGNSGL